MIIPIALGLYHYKCTKNYESLPAAAAQRALPAPAPAAAARTGAAAQRALPAVAAVVEPGPTSGETLEDLRKGRQQVLEENPNSQGAKALAAFESIPEVTQQYLENALQTVNFSRLMELTAEAAKSTAEALESSIQALELSPQAMDTDITPKLPSKLTQQLAEEGRKIQAIIDGALKKCSALSNEKKELVALAMKIKIGFRLQDEQLRAMQSSL